NDVTSSTTTPFSRRYGVTRSDIMASWKTGPREQGSRYHKGKNHHAIEAHQASRRPTGHPATRANPGISQRGPNREGKCPQSSGAPGGPPGMGEMSDPPGRGALRTHEAGAGTPGGGAGTPGRRAEAPGRRDAGRRRRDAGTRRRAGPPVRGAAAEAGALRGLRPLYAPERA